MFAEDSPCVATDSESFQATVLGAELPVLVDFWAPWCTPCRIAGPVMEELAIEFSDELIVATVNTDENQSIAQLYQVRSIPTFALFYDGSLKQVWVGARAKASFRAELVAALAQCLK